jgi:hypothetical protein
MTKPTGRWFCTNYDDNFYTDDYDESIRHQCNHELMDMQIRCGHEPPCDSLYEHKQKTPGRPGEENW